MRTGRDDFKPGLRKNRPARLARAAALSGMALLVGAGMAGAADLSTGIDTSTVDPNFNPVQASSIWNGAYAGLYGGVAWKKAGVMGSDDIDFGAAKDVGVYLGANREVYGPIVAGLEAMGGYSGASEREGGYRVEQDWEGSLRARMGYAFEQNLVYGLAGLSAARVTAISGSETDTNWLTGWSVGAGVERQLTDTIVGRIEYDYSRYGGTRFDLPGPNREIDMSDHGLKLGVGVKF